jgi:uncharacterized damage-inducible protein DinB
MNAQIQSLSKLYGLNHYTLTVNLAGLTHEDSVAGPNPGGNCANWVLGHILANRNAILSLLHEEPVLGEAEAKVYERGSPQMNGGAGAIPLERLIQDLERSQERLLRGLSRLSPEDLDAPVEQSTLGATLAFLQFHEAYHAGQVGLLRRMAGREGAIR